jgi:hypothetical protein
MRQHGPEAPERPSRNARPQHRHVTLEKAADEILAPVLAEAVVGGEEAVGETATVPQPGQISGWNLQRFDRSHFEIADTPGQAFPGLAD